MPVYQFGAGVLTAIPTVTLAGVAVTVPTPQQFGALQDVTVDCSVNLKELFGQYRYPLAIGMGTGKVTLKAKSARISAAQFNFLFGETNATGETKVAFEEAGTIPTTPFAVTVANSATWVLDLGVTASLTGLPLTRVASAPATGQYSVAAGVYTFAAADTGLAMKISYTYTSAAAPGHTVTMNNQLIGLQPFYKVVLGQQFKGKHFVITFNNVSCGKLSFGTKLEDFTIPEFDMSCSCDDSNVLGTISASE